MDHDLSNASVNDFEIRVGRTGGKYYIFFTGIPTPPDISGAQKHITDSYRAEKAKLVAAFHKSSQKFKTQKREAIELQREAEAQKREAEELKQAALTLMQKVQSKQGAKV